MSTVAAWIQEYEDNFALDWLATNPNPNLISYLKENPESQDINLCVAHASMSTLLKGGRKEN